MSEIDNLIKEMYNKGLIVDRKPDDKPPVYKRNTGKGKKIKNYLKGCNYESVGIQGK